MTSQERTRLIEMRQAGATFTKIAAALHVSKSTLKSFYRRMEGDAPSAKCIRCGKPLPHETKHRYCSDSCRFAWCYEHRVLDTHNAIEKQ